MQIMEDGTVVALEDREVYGEHQKGKVFKNYVRVHKIIKLGVAIYDMANISKKKSMELKRWKVVENT